VLVATSSADARRFDSLVKPHLPVLYRLAARACGDPALAEDAVQETLVLAFKRLKQLQPGASVRAFLAGIAVKRAHTLLRGERRRRQREEAMAPPSASANPEQLAQSSAMQRQIRDALWGMPKKRRTAALLRLDAGLDYVEIAQAMGTSAGSARTLVHLALKELRSVLKEQSGR